MLSIVQLNYRATKLGPSIIRIMFWVQHKIGISVKYQFLVVLWEAKLKDTVITYQDGFAAIKNKVGYQQFADSPSF